MKMNRNIFWLAITMLILTGCAATTPSKGGYKVGKPYMVNGKLYYPEVNYAYSETGIASWYGPGFHGKKTANGERFDQNELTAAHRTLPMPSIVRVTNLQNGKSVVVRVNDRGPFSKSRIIDVSQKAAELLGFKGQGTAKVRVTILEKESRRIADAAMKGEDTRGMMYASGGPEEAVTQHAAVEPVAVQRETLPGSVKLSTSSNTVVPGHINHGAFYPDSVVSQEAVTSTKIYIQAGAFSAQENALTMASRLKSFGEPQIKSVNISGSTLYRVRLPVHDAAEAESLMAKLSKAGHKQAAVVVE